MEKAKSKEEQENVKKAPLPRSRTKAKKKKSKVEALRETSLEEDIEETLYDALRKKTLLRKIGRKRLGRTKLGTGTRAFLSPFFLLLETSTQSKILQQWQGEPYLSMPQMIEIKALVLSTPLDPDTWPTPSKVTPCCFGFSQID